MVIDFSEYSGYIQVIERQSIHFFAGGLKNVLVKKNFIDSRKLSVVLTASQF